MRKISLIIAGLLAGAVFMAGTPADAKGPGWKSGGGSPHGFSQGRKRGWNGAAVPPGWSKGRKRGWESADHPPGWYRNGQPQRSRVVPSWAR